MATNRDVIVKLRLAGEQFDRDFKVKFQDLTDAAEKASAESGAKAGGGFIKGFLGAAGVAGLGTAIGVAISSAADLGTEILSTSKQFKIGAEELQIWQQAALRAGVSTDDFKDALSTLTGRIGEAVAGNRAAQQAFVDLGVGFETTSGQARATDAVMLDLATRIGEINDPADRVRVGMQLLGDDFNNLYPLLVNGADGFNKMAAETSQFGTVLTQKELQDLDSLNKSLEEMKNQLSRRVDQVIAQNAAQIENLADKLYGLADAAVQATGDYLNWYRQMSNYANIPDPSKLGGPGYQRDYRTPEGDEAIRKLLAPSVAAPRVSPLARRGGGGGGGATRPQKSEEEKAAEAAIKAEQRMREAVERTRQAQEDSAKIAETRAQQGNIAAAMLEAQLNLQRQQPGILAQSVEELAKALGYTKALTTEERKRLETQLATNKAVVATATQTASGKAWGDVWTDVAARYAKDKAANEAAAKNWQQEYERAIYDVANIYESAFRGGTKDLWRNFKDEGIRIIAEVAAQWTLSKIGGQGFDLGSAFNSAFGRSPLSSIFFGSGGGGAANDNRAGSSANRSAAASAWEEITGGRSTSGSGVSARLGGVRGAANTIGAAIPQVGMYFAAAQASNLVGTGLSKVFGLPYSQTGGSLFGAVGGLIGGLLKGTPRGSANLTGANQFTLSGNNKSGAQDTASSLAGQVSDTLLSIAQRLGGSVGSFATSIGVSGDSFHVDPTGRGRLKKSQGGKDFNQDQAAAIAYAVADAISDGAITGISQAAQNLIRKGGDLEKQIEKALLIEELPKLLKQRTDPLGTALDALYDKFKKVNDALVEGSASAEQFAQARQLWELEKADAIASIGAASKTLKDFLASLNAGSNSPLSLREQRTEAEKQLAPFLAQITAAENARAEVERLKSSGATAAEIAAAEEKARTAAGSINQDGFTQASQLLLSISRQSNASSGAFFGDFERIRALTGQAIGFVDQASARPGDARDPFSAAIAKSTQDAAYILSDQTKILNQILQAINDNGLGVGGGGGFITDGRGFVNIAKL